METPINLVLINEYIKNTNLSKEVYSELLLQKVSISDNSIVPDLAHLAPLVMALIAAHRLLLETEITVSVRDGAVTISYYSKNHVNNSITVNQSEVVMECHGGEVYTVKSGRGNYEATTLPLLLEHVMESSWDVKTRSMWSHYIITAQNLLDPRNPIYLIDIIDVCRDRRCAQVHELNMLELELVETKEEYDVEDSKVAQRVVAEQEDEAARKKLESSKMSVTEKIKQVVKDETPKTPEQIFNQFHGACDTLSALQSHALSIKTLRPTRFEIWGFVHDPIMALGFMSHVNALGTPVICYYINYGDKQDLTLNELDGNTYSAFSKDLASRLEVILSAAVKHPEETTAICQFVLNALALESEDDPNAPEVTNIEDAGGEVKTARSKKIFKQFQEDVLNYLNRFKSSHLWYESPAEEQEFELVYNDDTTLISMGFGCFYETTGDGNGFWVNRKDGSDFNVHSLEGYDNYTDFRTGLRNTLLTAEFSGYSPEQANALREITNLLNFVLNP